MSSTKLHTHRRFWWSRSHLGPVHALLLCRNALFIVDYFGASVSFTLLLHNKQQEQQEHLNRQH